MSDLHVKFVPVRHCFIGLPRGLFTPPTVKDGPLTLRLEWLPSGAYTRQRVWVGWGGQTCPDGQLAIPDRLAACFDLKENTPVSVAIEHSPPIAKMVHIEPVSADDWEVLELNAGVVEATMTEQINVLSEGFKFPLWVGKTVIYFKLVSIEGKKQETSYGYDKSFARLSPYQSEVVVKPISRLITKEKKDAAGEDIVAFRSVSLRVQPFWDQVANDLMQERGDDEEVGGVNSYSWYDDGLKKRARARVVYVSSNTYTKLNMQKSHGNGDNDSLLEAPIFFGLSYTPSKYLGKTADESPKPSRRTDVVRVEAWHRVNEGHIMIPGPLQELMGVPFFGTVTLQRASSRITLSSQKILSLVLRPVVWNQPASESSPEVSYEWAAEVFDRWLSSLVEPIPLTNGCVLPLSPEDQTADDNERTQRTYQFFAVYINQPTETTTSSSTSTTTTTTTVTSLAPPSGQKITNDASKPTDPTVLVSHAISYYVFDMFTRIDFSKTNIPNRVINPSIQLSLLPWPTFGPPLRLTQTNDTFRSVLQRSSLCSPPVSPLDLPSLSTFPFVRLAGLAGTEEATAAALGHLKVLLFQPLIKARYELGTPSPGGIVLCGPGGYGKSSVAMALASYCRYEGFASVLWVACRDLIAEKISALTTRFSDMFKLAKEQSPTLIVLDDLDQLTPSQGGAQGSADLRSTQIAEMLSDLILTHTGGLRSRPAPGYGNGALAVLATSQSLSALHPALLEAGLLTHRIDLKAPDGRNRERVLRARLRRSPFVKCHADLESLAANLEGYTANDLQQVVQRALFAASIRHFASAAKPALLLDSERKTESMQSIEVSDADFNEAVQGFVPSSLKDLTLHQSSVAWADVGGLDNVRAVLKETLELPSRYARLFAAVPLKLRSGLLLYGPPGCGKTHLASAVAQECGLHFISVKGPELLNKYIGASEQAVRDAFSRAAACAPSILFFDEFEAICPKRGGDSTGVTDRVVNQFLTFLDGVESRTGVYVLAASSRPDLIDPAILRPGRLDKPLYCGLPSATERLSILQACSHKLTLGPDVDLGYIASKTENYTGADLQAIVSNAMLEVVHDQMESSTPVPLGQRHLLLSLGASSSSLSDKDRAKFERIYRKFVSSRNDKSDTFDPNGPMKTAQAQ